ncbi:uncharacterized protein CANTADRAFT_6009 [Suhomyces tanzawaensis NRRL Y-17324]|uniref:PCI domain-containing protein n=1 Tax=Suhomyces tanzawaensis NRRL Y-17324 TaxID=984487 RepID=A0A1E4SLJ3_9ASCO|nr:uncharacterized protein CANTADRAFT_6009 [Suhomyces tanzawaensis NRRL Y-17324]ODV80370.1 hypothetical protein CANTADRAFT_6009 [Suhomyces tanzawaensis NRRL Y-17324]
MQALLKPTYNFLDLLPNDDPIVELFCFGTYSDYLKHKKHYEPIGQSRELLTKLIKLTILTMVQDNEGQTVPAAGILRQYNLDVATDKLASLTGQNKSFVIEEILMAMIDEESVDVHIDDEYESWHLNMAHTLRDSYDPSVHKLVVLQEKDILTRSLDQATHNIRTWHQERLNPTSASLQRGLASPNSRKRKTPDNCV